MMLTAIPVTYTDKRTAQTALTEFRKKYRLALRGAVVCERAVIGGFVIVAPLGGTGFSAAEFTSALRAGNY